MHISQVLAAAAIAASSAIAAPAAEVVSMAAGSSWTFEGVKRVCNSADTKCTWTFTIDTHTNTTPCTYVVSGAGASTKDGGPAKCGRFTLTSGWSGQFGPGNGFTVIAVVDNNRNIAYPSYTDAELKGGKTVKPNRSYPVQKV